MSGRRIEPKLTNYRCVPEFNDITSPNALTVLQWCFTRTVKVVICTIRFGLISWNCKKKPPPWNKANLYHSVNCRFGSHLRQRCFISRRCFNYYFETPLRNVKTKSKRPAEIFQISRIEEMVFVLREKGDLTQSYDNNPYTNRKFENQWTTQKRH